MSKQAWAEALALGREGLGQAQVLVRLQLAESLRFFLNTQFISKHQRDEQVVRHGMQVSPRKPR